MGRLSKDKSSKRKLPLDEEAYYLEAMAILRSLPESTHPVWADLEEELEESPASQRSKSLLYQKLEKACAEEDLDWKEFDFIKTACQHRPKMIQVKDAAVLLYKLMGIYGGDGSNWKYEETDYLHIIAFTKDEKSAESVFLFLELLRIVQRSVICKNPSDWYPALRIKCRKVENRLEKLRGAPKMRQFMELWAKTAGNGNEDDCEEDGSPSRKRRCIKAEE